MAIAKLFALQCKRKKKTKTKKLTAIAELSALYANAKEIPKIFVLHEHTITRIITKKKVFLNLNSIR